MITIGTHPNVTRFLEIFGCDNYMEGRGVQMGEINERIRGCGKMSNILTYLHTVLHIANSVYQPNFPWIREHWVV